jgi:hypothetical protein
LHISGASNHSLLRVGSPTQANILFVSGSGNVGIGTTIPSASLHISGANADSLFRIQSPASASIIFVTGSGNVGIGTLNPLSQLHITASRSNELLRITSGSQNILNIRSGSAVFFAGTGVAPTAGYDLDVQGTGTANGGSVRIAGNSTVWNFASTSAVSRGATGNQEMFNVSMTGTSTTLVQNPMSVTFNANQNATSGSGYIVLRLNATHATTAGTGSKLLQSWEFGGVRQSIIDLSGSLGIGTGSAPPARLFISGANAQSLLRIASPASSSILSVSGSGYIGIGIASPAARLHISGASANGLFEIDSPAVNNIIYVSGSGNVGIGTNLPSADLHISGASADSLLRVGSPTNDNILFVTGSGNVGIGTITPQGPLHIRGTSVAGITPAVFLDTNGTDPNEPVDIRLASGGARGIRIIASSSLSGIPGGASIQFYSNNSANFGGQCNIDSGTTSSSALIFRTANTAASVTERMRIAGNGTVSITGAGTTAATTILNITDSNPTTRFTILGDGTSAFNTNHLYVSGSGLVGVGTTLPTAELHISGASADSLLRVGSPSNANILFVTGSGRVGINTTSSTSFLGGNISTFTIFQNSGSGDGLTPSVGLQVVNSGSSTSAQANISIVTIGNKFASLNIGTSGSGTDNNYWQFSKRNSAASHAFQLYNNNNGTFSSPLFSFVKSGNSILGENNQIQIDDANGRVGLQITPSDYIHLSSSPGGGAYLRIDATSIQAPPLTTVTPDTGYGITTNKYYLAEPDYWMEISLDGVIVLIPCYLPA